MANTSAFQCISNNRAKVVAGVLDSDQAVIEADRFIRATIPGFNIYIVEESPTDSDMVKESPPLPNIVGEIPPHPDTADAMGTLVSRESIEIYIYESIWYIHNTGNNTLEKHELPAPSNPDHRVRYDGDPQSNGKMVYALVFFTPNPTDSGLRPDNEQYPDISVENVESRNLSIGLDRPGSTTALIGSCMCSINPDYAGCM